MKIKTKDYLLAGDVQIPPGEYMVSLRSDIRQMTLSGGGMDYKIPAVKRPSKKIRKTTDIQFYPSGGPNFSLLIKTPKNGEWISQLKLSNRADKKD